MPTTHWIAPVSQLDEPALAAWRQLAADALEPNVFYTPEFLIPTNRHFGGDIQLLVVEEDGTWLAALPFELAPGDQRWPLRHASTNGPLLHEYTSAGLPLIAASDPEGNIRMLVDALRARRRRLGFALTIHLATADGPVSALLEPTIAASGSPVHTWGGDARAAVRYRERTVADPSDLVSRSRARELRRCQRLIGVAYHQDPAAPVTMVELAGPSRLPSTATGPAGTLAGSPAGVLAGTPAGTPTAAGLTPCREYLEFEQKSWKGDPRRKGPAFALRPGGSEWFQDVFEGLLARGDAYLLALRAGSDTLHMSTYLRSGSTVYCWYDAYDPAAAHFSPGVLGRVLGAVHLAADPSVDLLDTCMDPSRYAEQTLLYPDRVTTTSFTTSLGPWTADAALRARVAAGTRLHRLRPPPQGHPQTAPQHR